jgi:methylated-DNA-[protein]-cysteine S-methyltransferase
MNVWFQCRNGQVVQAGFGDNCTTPDGYDDTVHAQLAAYLGGRRRSFDLHLAPMGTPFQLRVWTRLCQIPWGETRSYAEVARALGMPAAARAVGRACGQNPVPIFIPCHRVVGADGGLGGYSPGLAHKRALLHLEGARENPRQ